MANTTWNDICKTVEGWGKKVNRSAEQLTETAALKLKLSAKKAELEEAYIALGKLYFELHRAEMPEDIPVEDLSAAEPTEVEEAAEAAEDALSKDALAVAVETVEALRREIAKLEAALAERKQK